MMVLLKPWRLQLLVELAGGGGHGVVQVLQLVFVHGCQSHPHVTISFGNNGDTVCFEQVLAEKTRHPNPSASST